MPQILPKLLYQVAIYWDIGILTETGRRDYASVVPIEVACHWTNELNFTPSNDGRTPKSTARVLTLVEVVEGGVLWLTSATTNDPAGTGLAQIPSAIPYHNKIEHIERHYSISADEILYKAFI